MKTVHGSLQHGHIADIPILGVACVQSCGNKDSHIVAIGFGVRAIIEWPCLTSPALHFSAISDEGAPFQFIQDCLNRVLAYLAYPGYLPD